MDSDEEDRITAELITKLFFGLVDNVTRTDPTKTNPGERWNIDATEMARTLDDNHLVISIRDLLLFIERLAENKIVELKLTGINLQDCYYEENRDHSRSPIRGRYSGWTVRKISIFKCYIGTEFLLNIIDKASCFNEGTNGDSYIGRNLIEEIRIIDCDAPYPIDLIDNNDIVMKGEIAKLLRDNYRIKVIDIINLPINKDILPVVKNMTFFESQTFLESQEISRKIDLLLKRNNKGHELCLSMVYNILLIKKYRDSIFDILPRDIIKLICELILDTKGTKIWCL